MEGLAAQHVHLVPIRESDRQGLSIALNDPAAWGNRQLEVDPPHPLTDGELDGVFEEMNAPEHGEHYVIEVADSPVGHAGARRWWDAMTQDIALFVAPSARRKGYGTEAIAVLLAHVFDTTVAESVHAWVPSWDSAGCHFLEQVGFRKAGRNRRTGLRGGSWYDEVAFDLLRDEWPRGDWRADEPKARRGDRR